MKRLIASFGFALGGFKTTWREEPNFRIEVIIGLLVILLCTYFQFTMVEWLFCIIAIIIVITAEMVNTAIEDLSDVVEPNQNPFIGKIKDTMAGFVLVSSFGAFIIGCFVFLHHFF